MNIFTLPQSAGGVLLGVAILLTAGFLMTRLTRRLHLPNVTGYILAGILVGPYALNLIPAWLSGGMEFVTDLALSYIAFSAGRYFRIADLKRSGGKVLAVTLAEALCAAVAVTLTMIFVFRLSVPFALLLGAIGCATAPASTIMTIRQYRAKGPFVNLLLQVTALDDAVALTAFSVCTAVVNALQTGHIQFADVALPLLWNLGAVALGLALAVLLSKEVKGMPAFRTIYYLPTVVPIVASAMLFLWVLNPEYGLLNNFLSWFGIRGPSWLSDPKFTKISLMIMDVWRCGQNTVIFLSALKAVPKSFYEAAELDGAGPVKRFFKITLPYISPTIQFLVVMGLISSFQYFTQAYVFASVSQVGQSITGGPQNSLLFYSMYLYMNGFSYMKMGYASAMAIVLFLIVLVVSFVAMYLMEKRVAYDVE